MFPAPAVTCTGETRTVSVTARPEAARRLICPRCGTKVIAEPNGDIRALSVALCDSTEWFRPAMHLQWQGHLLEVRDELPKFVDCPKELGGSGELA